MNRVGQYARAKLRGLNHLAQKRMGSDLDGEKKEICKGNLLLKATFHFASSLSSPPLMDFLAVTFSSAPPTTPTTHTHTHSHSHLPAWIYSHYVMNIIAVLTDHFVLTLRSNVAPHKRLANRLRSNDIATLLRNVWFLKLRIGLSVVYCY